MLGEFEKMKTNNVSRIISFFIISMFALGSLIPLTLSTDHIQRDGFDKGPSYTSVVPMKKVTFINFDENTLLDDYAYLAAVPTAVFKQNNTLYSHPLLFFDDEYSARGIEDRTLNPRQGLDYFMQDWMSYCNNQIDEMIAINIPKNKLQQWNSRNCTIIDSDNPFEISGKLAVHDWKYSNDAVIAVIEEYYENPRIETKGTMNGTIKASKIERNHFKMQRPVIGTGATYETFEINDEIYRYILVQMSWSGKQDYDLQLYDPELGMVETAFDSYDSPFPFTELVGSYIFNKGLWEISVSAQAKKTLETDKGKMESMCYYSTPKPTGLASIFNRNTVDIDIALLPGVILPFEPTPFGCRDIEITLKTNNPSISLGFSVIDPIGTEIASSFSISEAASKCLNMNTISEKDDHEMKFTLEKLGETSKEDTYSLCVFSIGDLLTDVDFTIDYSWRQNFTKEEGDGIESACNGAVLASTLNAPLLYTTTDYMDTFTKNVLCKLGVNNIYLVDIGAGLSNDVVESFNEIATVKQRFTHAKDIYDSIRDNSGENDVIFTTIDSYDYWYVANDKEETGRASAGQWDGAYHFGQAAYIAAHHGSPVIIVDNHPKLSQAITWPTNWWRENAYNRYNLPSAGAMTLTSKNAYEFLKEYGFGEVEPGGAQKQDHEIIITVAGQFDIGIPWDRAFLGAALSGRFWGHPVDSAYAICRNIFYPTLIFENPAMKKVTLIQGSESTTTGIGDSILDTNLGIGNRLIYPYGRTIKITKPMQEMDFLYPVLQTYCTYAFRYNENNWKHFNCKYTRADAIIPWDTPSPDRIDDGVAHGKTGAYYPDISESEVIPFYCEKAGYDNVFSTSFYYLTSNLNSGVLLWVSQIHGHHGDGGSLEIWDIDSPYTYEENPWRGYEPIALKPGKIDEFIRWSIGYRLYHIAENIFDKDIPLLDRISKIPTRPIELFPERGSTENPDVAFLNPQLSTLGKLTKPLQIGGVFDIWGAWPFMIYRNRIINPFETIENDLPFFNFADGDGKVLHSPPTGGRLVGKQFFGPDFDDILENLHSVGINTISCLPAYTYMHLTWMRHGSVYQIIDPWTTTDWAGIWNQMMIKLFSMGYTVGQAYERGLRAVGPLYSCGQSWWDLWENVVYTGDPNLRVFVPNTEFTDSNNGYIENHWTYEETRPLSFDATLSIEGHMPFGADSYPHARERPLLLLGLPPLVIVLLVLLAVLVLCIWLIGRWKR